MTTYLQQADYLVRHHEVNKELMELGKDCRIKYPMPKRYVEADVADNEEMIEATVLGYAMTRSYDDWDEYFEVWNDFNEQESLAGKYDEDEIIILGKPPQLQHYLRVLQPCDNKDYSYFLRGEYWLQEYNHGDLRDVETMFRFDLTTGAPATEEDAKAFLMLLGEEVSE